jgi:ComF family protein
MSLFVHYCLLCEQPVERDLDLCIHCESSLPWNRNACERCALPIEHDEPARCARCSVEPPPCLRTVAPFIYEDPTRRWIRQFKFKRDWRSGKVLAHCFASAVVKQLSGEALPDVILPVPLSIRRLLWRGHNQSLALATGIAREIERPVRTRWLKRIRHKQPQATLSLAARERNMRSVFAAKPDVAGLHIALVDDVYTTGATLRSATSTLLDAGARAVQWWVAARTR